MLAVKEEDTGRVHPVFFPRISFGRDANRCDVFLNEPVAARKHFELSISENGKTLLVVDCGSASGTAVNGQRLYEESPTSLMVNDRITIGQKSLIVVECGRGKETIERSREKLVRIRIECDRLRAKEGFDGLSASQQKTLDKYEADILRIKKTIIDAVNGGKAPTEDDEHPAEDEYWNVAVVEDDGLSNTYVDLTEKKKAAQSTTTVETYDSLMKKVSDLDKECETLENEIRTIDTAGANAGHDDEEEDELDKFMAENEKGIKSADLERAQRRLKEAQTERTRYQALADIARPAMHRLSTQSSNTAPLNTGGGSVNTHNVSKLPFESSAFSSTATKPKPEFVVQQSKIDQIFARPTATLSVRPHVNKFRLVQEERDESEEESGSSKKARTDFNKKTDEERDPVWIPPTNQTDNGRTKVNERFGY